MKFEGEEGTPSLLTFFLLIAIILIWGYAWVLMKITLDYMGPFTSSALRFILGSLTMAAILLWKKIPLPKRDEWLYLALLGFLQTTCVFLLVMYGMLFVSAGKSSILLYSMPFWSMLLSYLYLEEEVNRRKIVGLLLGVLGLICIIGWDLFRFDTWKVILGDFLILLAAFSWGTSNVLIKKWFQSHNKLQVSAWQMIIGTLGIGLAALVMEGEKTIVFTPLSIIAIIVLGVLASAFCFTSWYMVLSKLDTTTATMALLFVPVSALFLSQLQLSENIHTGVLIGTIFISIGVYVACIEKIHR